MIPWLQPDEPFPPVSSALQDPSGLLAASLELSPERILQAYRQGIFPWFNQDQPVLWWSTDPRMVLYTNELHITHSLRKTLCKTALTVRCDTAFIAVMQACAAPRQGQQGTWISPLMIEMYGELHRRGVAHSVEVWSDDQLVGGLYGLSIGHMFYGESMFTRVTNASKIALVHLVNFLRRQGCPMIDCQQQTAHLASLGARPVERSVFIEELQALIDLPTMVWPKQFDIAEAE